MQNSHVTKGNKSVYTYYDWGSYIILRTNDDTLSNAIVPYNTKIKACLIKYKIPLKNSS